MSDSSTGWLDRGITEEKIWKVKFVCLVARKLFLILLIFLWFPSSRKGMCVQPLLTRRHQIYKCFQCVGQLMYFLVMSLLSPYVLSYVLCFGLLWFLISFFSIIVIFCNYIFGLDCFHFSLHIRCIGCQYFKVWW